MQTEFLIGLGQHFRALLMYVGVAVIVMLFAAVVFFKIIAPALEAIRRWMNIDRNIISRVLLAVFAFGLIQYGSTKMVWHKVANSGADSGTTLVGVFTAISNDVVEVEGVVTTNEIPMIAVMTLTNAIPVSTEISVRMSDTNEWTTLTKTNPYFETQGQTNTLYFTADADYSGYVYWWIGSDKPAVIITTTGITITGFNVNSHAVTLSWSCDQPLATTFTIQWKEHTDSTWNDALTTTQRTATLNGFWIDKTIDWRIISEYLEDGE